MSLAEDTINGDDRTLIPLHIAEAIREMLDDTNLTAQQREEILNKFEDMDEVSLYHPAARTPYDDICAYALECQTILCNDADTRKSSWALAQKLHNEEISHKDIFSNPELAELTASATEVLICRDPMYAAECNWIQDQLRAVSNRDIKTSLYHPFWWGEPHPDPLQRPEQFPSSESCKVRLAVLDSEAAEKYRMKNLPKRCSDAQDAD